MVAGFPRNRENGKSPGISKYRLPALKIPGNSDKWARYREKTWKFVEPRGYYQLNQCYIIICMKNVLNQSFTELQMGIRRELAIYNRSFFVVLKLVVFSATPDTGI